MKRPLPPRTVSPTLRELFRIAEEQGVSARSLARSLRTSATLIGNWRRGDNAPSLLTIEEMAGVLGYRLRLEKLEETGY